MRKFEEQLPDALMMLAGGLRAGLSLSTAITQLVLEAQAPLGQEFSLMLREQRMGVTVEQSLNGLMRRVPTPTTILVVSSMRIANETAAAWPKCWSVPPTPSAAGCKSKARFGRSPPRGNCRPG
ncbi:type II secretion system F family protein [Rugamonas sp. CCM 8940]